MFVQVYDVTREYGGPEEGGWWYDRIWVLWTKRCKKRLAKKLAKRLQAEIKPNKYDRFSVLGGADGYVHLGARALQSTGRMRYE